GIRISRPRRSLCCIPAAAVQENREWLGTQRAGEQERSHPRIQYRAGESVGLCPSWLGTGCGYLVVGVLGNSSAHDGGRIENKAVGLDRLDANLLYDCYYAVDLVGSFAQEIDVHRWTVRR